MLIASGHFDAKGNPCLKVGVAGVFVQPPGVEFEAIIDTGFSGFLCVPMVRAFPLGVPLIGTTNAILADGKTSPCLTAVCRLTVGAQTKSGVVLLQNQSKDCLLGMDFLRKFQASLFLTKSAILLLDENALEKLAQGQAKEAAAKKADAKQAQAPDEKAAVPPQKPVEPDAKSLQ